MVIFDSRTMLTGSGNQYVNPDYLRPLSPLPSELDAKASPLALLAKTCSQIGAEPSLPNGNKNGKFNLQTSNSGKRQDTNKESKSVSPAYSGYRSDSRGLANPSADRLGSRSRSGSVEIKVTDSGSNPHRDEVGKARSSLSSNVSSLSAKSPTTSLNIAIVEDDATTADEDDIAEKRRRLESPARSSPSLTPTSSTSALSDIKSSPSKPVTSSSSTTLADPSPIIRSGLEVLAGHHGSSSNSRESLLYGGYRPSQLPPSLGYPGFPGGSSFPSHLSANPFWASFMSNSSGVCRDPLCGDPYCPTALRNQQLFAAATGRLSASSALSNYSSLFSAAAAVQQREAAMMAAQRTAVAMAQVAAAASTPPGSAGGPKPYVCNWVAGADYCGRRFSSSEDLLSHLKTHTNLSTSDHRSLSASILAGVSSTGSSTPTSSTLSAAAAASRFHPYARPLGSGLPPSLASALNPSLGLPPGYPNPYASLYPSLFPRPPLL